MEQSILRAYALGKVDYFGVADLDRVQDTLKKHYHDSVRGYPFAVSLGIALINPIVDQLPAAVNDVALKMQYRHHAYDLINQRLDYAASGIASILQKYGHRALPVAASQTIDRSKLISMFSHKMAARLAGLGFIGKNCLLITPSHGPRVRWATVLTDAPLSSTYKDIEQGCGTCTQCVDICPVNAFTGRDFSVDEERSFRFDAFACDTHLKQVEARDGYSVCGLCLYACPYGRSSSHAGDMSGE